MNNDEMFFLCMLSGAEEILGIKNPIQGLSEQEIKEKWDIISKGLYEKEILCNDESGEVCICEEYSKTASAISFPDTAFVCSEQDGEPSFVYIRGSVYLHLIHQEQLEIKSFENREDFIEFLNQKFMLTASDSDIYIELTMEEMERAVELLVEGKLPEISEDFELIEGSQEDLKSALDIFVNGKDSRDFAAYKQNQETPVSTLFRTIKTEAGTWLFKICNGSVKIFRCNPDKVLVELLNF